jgi:cell division protein FtsB
VAIDRRWRRWGVRGSLLGLAAYYAVWGGEYSTFDLRRLESERAAEAARAERLEVEADSLRRRAKALESDPAALERLARERFGMIRPGEVLFRFVEVEPDEEDRTGKLATGP